MHQLAGNLNHTSSFNCLPI